MWALLLILPATPSKQREQRNNMSVSQHGKTPATAKKLYLVQCAEHTKQHLAQVVDIMELLAADRLGHIPSNNAL